MGKQISAELEEFSDYHEQELTKTKDVVDSLSEQIAIAVQSQHAHPTPCSAISTFLENELAVFRVECEEQAGAQAALDQHPEQDHSKVDAALAAEREEVNQKLQRLQKTCLEAAKAITAAAQKEFGDMQVEPGEIAINYGLAGGDKSKASGQFEITNDPRTMG